MKCYAMMYRKKWKDAVDLYWILHHTDHSLQDCINASSTIFQSLYQPRATLETILENQRDMTETVQRIINHPDDSVIQSSLIDIIHKYYQTFDT